MEKKHYWGLFFDLDTEEIEYQVESRKRLEDKSQRLTSKKDAYRKISRFFKKEGFAHPQYSGYVTTNKQTLTSIVNLTKKMVNENKWLPYVVRDFRANIENPDINLCSIIRDIKNNNEKEFEIDNDITLETISKPKTPKERLEQLGIDFDSLIEQVGKERTAEKISVKTQEDMNSND